MSRGAYFTTFVAACLTAGDPCWAANFSGACFTVHGRLSQSNGNPGYRIWKVGTRHNLGVLDCQGRDESDQAIPANVQAIAGRYVEKDVYGDFEVCPFDLEQPGRMQHVCIKRASHLIVEKLP